MEADLVIRSVLLPAVAVAVAAAALSFAAGRAGGRARASMMQLLPVLAVLPAFRALAVQEGTIFASGLAPSVSYGWLPTAILVGACCAAAIAGPGPRAAVPAASAVASFAAMALIAPPGYRGGEAQFVAALVATVSAAASAMSGLAATGAGGRGSRAAFASWWLVMSVASGFAIASGFAKLAFVAASLAGASAALGTLSIGIRAIRHGPSLAIAFATALVAISFVGLAYDEAPLPKACWAILALSPAASILAWLPPLRDRPRASAAVREGAPPIVAAVALAAALLASGARDAGAPGDAYAAAASAPISHPTPVVPAAPIGPDPSR
jgi:hypothetical protein